jgi:hypothetical protein
MKLFIASIWGGRGLAAYILVKELPGTLIL